jgi:hypothetical protein
MPTIKLGSNPCPKRGKPWGLGVALALSLLAAVIDTQAIGYPDFTGLILGICVLLMPIFIVLSLFNINRRFTASLLVVFTVSVGTHLYCEHLDGLAEVNALPVIDAIDKYRLANGKYPDGLDALIPVYIGKLPLLKPMDMSSGLKYEISTGGSPKLYFKNGLVFSHRAFLFSYREWRTYN